MKSVVVLISGRGSNLQAILEEGIPVRAVISNKSDAEGLEIAKRYGIETAVVPHQDFSSREQFDKALALKIEQFSPDYIVMAGFMRILGNDFVGRFQGKLINIHPSLLPSFPGMNTHERALEEGVKIHGCTVHFVTENLDHGPIIAQEAVRVFDEDSAEALAQRVLEAEHTIFPQTVRRLLEGKLCIKGNRVFIEKMK